MLLPSAAACLKPSVRSALFRQKRLEAEDGDLALPPRVSLIKLAAALPVVAPRSLFEVEKVAWANARVGQAAIDGDDDNAGVTGPLEGRSGVLGRLPAR